MRLPLASLALAAGLAAVLAAADPQPLPLLLNEDFSRGADRWEPTDRAAWRIAEADPKHGQVYEQFAQSKYQPPHRSPFNFSLLKGFVVGDFVLEADLQSTCKDYGHRDMCLVFGYQDAAHFYYVHLGKQTDDHANQVFIVHDAPRTKISLETSQGTPWDDAWHHVKIVRRVQDGTIEVYFDDMTRPVMRAKDTRLAAGRIGLGTFDDTGRWDNVRLSGRVVQP